MTALERERLHMFSQPGLGGSFLPTPLNHAHIQEAVEQSADNGATLVLSKKSLSDIGSVAVGELSIIGKDSYQDHGPLQRYDIMSSASPSSADPVSQARICKQLSNRPSG